MIKNGAVLLEPPRPYAVVLLEQFRLGEFRRDFNHPARNLAVHDLTKHCAGRKRNDREAFHVRLGGVLNDIDARQRAIGIDH